jgi:hypothetical protein
MTNDKCEFCGLRSDPEYSDTALACCPSCYKAHVMPKIRRLAVWNSNRYAVANAAFVAEQKKHMIYGNVHGIIEQLQK